MKIKLLISRAGVGFAQNCGDEIEVDDAEGMRMVKAGQATALTKVQNTSQKKHYQKATKGGK